MGTREQAAISLESRAVLARVTKHLLLFLVKYVIIVCNFLITGSIYKGHVETLAPAVMELAKLEKRVQTSFIDLKYKKKFRR